MNFVTLTRKRQAMIGRRRDGEIQSTLSYASHKAEDGFRGLSPLRII